MSISESQGLISRLNAVPTGYGGRAQLNVVQATCDGCDSHNVKVITIDLSGGEYRELHLCRRCLTKLSEAV